VKANPKPLNLKNVNLQQRVHGLRTSRHLPLHAQVNKLTVATADLPVRLPVHMSTHLSVCRETHPSIRLPFRETHPSIHLPFRETHPSICLPFHDTHPSIRLLLREARPSIRLPFREAPTPARLPASSFSELRSPELPAGRGT
jgi:hypothetical protein